MSKMNSQVDLFIAEAKAWQDILRKLRILLLDCGLEEELKWGINPFVTGVELLEKIK